jgi:hypothetical protein
MPVKYLSQEWIDADNDALAGDAVRGAGKVKIGGKMLKMMQLRGPLAQVQTALLGIETEY